MIMKHHTIKNIDNVTRTVHIINNTQYYTNIKLHDIYKNNIQIPHIRKYTKHNMYFVLNLTRNTCTSSYSREQADIVLVKRK